MTAPAFRRILFATDFSNCSQHAGALALELARRAGARLDVVHVLALHDADPSTAQERLPEVLPTGEGDPHVERLMERALSPELGILHTAREREADLIVVGTHGRKGLAHVLLGSVAERVVQLSDCPVLTVRDPGHTFQRP